MFAFKRPLILVTSHLSRAVRLVAPVVGGETETPMDGLMLFEPDPGALTAEPSTFSNQLRLVELN